MVFLLVINHQGVPSGGHAVIALGALTGLSLSVRDNYYSSTVKGVVTVIRYP